jgi:hypothetical protein
MHQTYCNRFIVVIPSKYIALLFFANEKMVKAAERKL